MKSVNPQTIELTVIVPTLNRGKVLFATIKQILRQKGVFFELIVVDQSDAQMATVNEAFCRDLERSHILYIHVERKNLPNARNVGLQMASAPIIVFVDDDIIILADDFLKAHLAAYADPMIGGATGRSVERSILVNSRRTACHVSIGGRTIFNLMGTSEQLIGGCKGSNMSFRTSVLPQVGGFDRQTELLEDADFSLRVIKAGWKVVYLPRAEVVHLSVSSGGVRLDGLIKDEQRRFRSTAYFIFKHRGWPGIIPFVATFSLIAVVRAWRLRSVGVFIKLMWEISRGHSIWKAGQDQELR